MWSNNAAAARLARTTSGSKDSSLQDRRHLKIAFLAHEYPKAERESGGVASYLSIAAHALADRGNEVHVLVCPPLYAHERDLDEMDGRVHVHWRKPPSFRGQRFVIKALGGYWALSHFLSGICGYQFVRQFGPFDVIEYNAWGGHAWLLAVNPGSALVAQQHGIPSAVVGRGSPIKVSRDMAIAEWLNGWTVRRAHVTSCQSQYNEETLRSVGWLKEGAVVRSPHPIDWRVWQRVTPVARTGPEVLWMGRLDQTKAPEVLLRAMAETPTATATLVGNSTDVHAGVPYIEWLRTFQPATCRFIGRIPRAQLLPLMSQARVVAMTSWFEGFGYTALEAMASGRPVVVTENMGIAEYVSESGAGAVIPPGSPQALAKALRPYLDDAEYAQEVGVRARDFIKRVMDPDTWAASREQIYRQAIGRQQRCPTMRQPRPECCDQDARTPDPVRNNHGLRFP